MIEKSFLLNDDFIALSFYKCSLVLNQSSVPIMESKRQERVSRMLQRELGDLFQRYDLEVAKNIMITVTQVRITADLSIARVYLSVFPSEQGDEILKIVNQHRKNLRYFLGIRIRHQIKEIPDVYFYLDDSLDYIEHIDNLLKE